jgi:hypothetical protein
MLRQKVMVQTAFTMDDDLAGAEDEDPAAQIPRLEAEIERLTQVAESCRKVILAAKVAIALAAVVVVVTLAGLIRLDQLVTLAAIATILGGIVAAGSNSRTLHEATAKIRPAEARRAELVAAVIDDTRPN